MTPIEKVMQALNARSLAPKKSGSGWSARCPAHDDRTPSLSVAVEPDEKVLLKCHAGCEFSLIVKALGLDEGDLFPPKDSNGRRIVAEYSYPDEKGSELFQTVRFEPKDFRQRHRKKGGEWAWSLNGVRRVLYRLPEVIEAVKNQTTIYIVEGEKDVEALRSLGLAATCNPMGAGKWRPEYSEFLVGARVVIISDNDEPGREHAIRVMASLRGKASSVARGEVAKGKDSADWIAAGATRDDFERLAAGGADRTQSATSARSEEQPPDPERSEPMRTSGPSPEEGDLAEVVRLTDVRPEPVEWLWYHRAAIGKLTLIDGDPGEGKSVIGVGLAACLSTGAELPGGGSYTASNVILLSAEDGLADTIRPRLDAAGGDPDRVHALTSVVRADGKHDFPSLLKDVEVIEAAARKHSAALVIIDPLMAYLNAKDSYKDADVRQVLAPVCAMAERVRVALLVVRHLNKGSDMKAIYRGGGSIGIVGAARSAFLVAPDPEDEGRRILACVKSNLCAKPPSLAYRIVGTKNGAPVVRWEPNPVEITADALLQAGADAAVGRRLVTDEATAFLRNALHGGERPMKELEEEAKAHGVSWASVRRVQRSVGVNPRKAEGKRGPWMWSLPSKVLG